MREDDLEVEIFTFLRHRWNVTRAERFIKETPREAEFVPTNKLALLLNLIRVNEEHVASVDLAKPIILAPLEDGYIPIDGWHRIAKAHAEGVKALPVVFLTDEEEEEVRI